MATKGKQIYEGKAKKVFETDNQDLVIIHYKDSATAFNGKKKAEITDKGIQNNTISNILFKKLGSVGIPTHLEEVIDEREIVAKKVKIIPLEVIVRNIVAGSLAKRTGLEDGYEIENPIVEFYYKNDELGDPLLTEDHINLLKLATKDELNKLRELGLKINDELRNIFKTIGLILVDFKLEFGYYKNEIILGDEISPDTCRLWDAETKKIMDKDRFRKDLGGLTESYQEILERLKSIEG